MDARRVSKQELLSRRARYATLEACQGRMNICLWQGFWTFFSFLFVKKKREQASAPRVWVTQISMTTFRLDTLIQWLEEMNLVILDGDISKEVLVKSSGIWIKRAFLKLSIWGLCKWMAQIRTPFFLGDLCQSLEEDTKNSVGCSAPPGCLVRISISIPFCLSYSSTQLIRARNLRVVMHWIDEVVASIEAFGPLFIVQRRAKKVTKQFVNVASTFNIQSWLCRVAVVAVYCNDFGTEVWWRRRWAGIQNSLSSIAVTC